MVPPRLDITPPPSLRELARLGAPTPHVDVGPPPSFRDLERPSVRQAFAAIGHALTRTVEFHPDVIALYDFASEPEEPGAPSEPPPWRETLGHVGRIAKEGRWAFYVEAWIAALVLHTTARLREQASSGLDVWRESLSNVFRRAPSKAAKRG